MEIESIESILRHPLSPGESPPDNASLRNLARGELKAFIKEVRNRRLKSPTALGEINAAEDRCIKALIAAYRAASEEHEALNPVVPISLSELSPALLQKILNGEEV